MRHKVDWHDHGREPQVEPDPRYPLGVDLDVSGGAEPSCKVTLDYPARRCGLYRIECQTCGLSVGVTTAGRPDDPRSVRLACDVKNLRKH